MKLSPNLQYKIAFWSITAPLMIPFLALVILAVLNPFWFRQNMLLWLERLARQVGLWRDDKTYVKYFYDKHTLFDKLRN